VGKSLSISLKSLDIIEDDYVFAVVVSQIYEFISQIESPHKSSILEDIDAHSYDTLAKKLTNGDEKCSSHTARLYTALSL